MFDNDLIEVAKSFLKRLADAYTVYSMTQDEYARIYCSLTKVTPTYGNKLGVRVSGGKLDNTEEQMALLADEITQLEKLKKDIEDVKSSISMVLVMANCTNIEKRVIWMRYGQIVMSYRRIWQKGCASSAGDAQRIEYKALEKIGQYLKNTNPEWSKKQLERSVISYE